MFRGLVTADIKVRVTPGENASKQMYQSSHCGQSFMKKSPHNPHLLTQTGGRPFQCDHCGSSFTFKTNLARHLRIHTGERPYKCDYCESSFARRGNLAVHLRSHTGNRLVKCMLLKLDQKLRGVAKGAPLSMAGQVNLLIQ
ncbi:uncharacterized protein LOC144109509 isoform X2 [Amblyomma americanum]